MNLTGKDALSASQRAAAVSRLDELIGKIDADSDSTRGLMREHLKSARSYLLGAMGEEYELNLRLISDLLPRLEDDGLKQEISDFLGMSGNPGSRSR